MFQEITWLGRGGQGAVTGTRLLASAALKEGIRAQSIVFFTAERRGSPVAAYNRVSDERIKDHHYPSKTEVVVVLDSDLLDQVGDHIEKGGTLILNSEQSDFEDLTSTVDKIAKLDATQISVDLDLTVAGLYVTNTIMLGAFSKVMGYPKLDSVEGAIKERWPGDPGELNAKAARRGYEATEIIYEDHNGK